MLKAFMTNGLILLFLGGVLHVDPHQHDYNQGYGFCDIGCDEENHHSITHQCEKCLNKTSRSIIQEKNDLSFKYNALSYWFPYQNFRNYLLNFSSYGRPPPSLL